MWHRMIPFCCLLGTVAVPETTFAQPKTAEVVPATPSATGPSVSPSDWNDPGFSRHLDLSLLVRGWTDLDPAILFDAAQQLAEGERILHRRHKMASSEELFALTLRLAADKGDKATLERIAMLKSGPDGLPAQAAAAAKLAGQTRAVPAFEVNVETTTPEAFALYRGFLLDIRGSRLAGDRDALSKIAADLEKVEGLQASQIQRLRKEVDDALSAIPKIGVPNPMAAKLDQLSAASRSLWDYQIPTGYSPRPTFQYPPRPWTPIPGTLGYDPNPRPTPVPPSGSPHAPLPSGPIGPTLPWTINMPIPSGFTPNQFQRRLPYQNPYSR